MQEIKNNENLPKAGQTISLFTKIWIILVPLVTLLDVLRPLGPLTLFLGAFCMCIFIILAFCFAIPALDNKCEKVFKENWPAAMMVAAFLFSFTLLGTYILEINTNNKGYLANKIPAFAQIQKDIGFIRSRLDDIAESNKKIANNTNIIAQNTEEIKSTNKQIAESNNQIANNTKKLGTVVKQEVSSDPRKELANFGITWSIQSYIKVLMSGDLRSISLFLDGGMKATTIHKGSSAILYAMQSNLGNNRIKIIDLFISKGFDINTNLKDKRILHNKTDGHYPRTYKAELKPEGYGEGDLYGKYFTGPILFWLIQYNSWSVPLKKDLELLQHLCSIGADKKYLLAYLNSPSVHFDFFEWQHRYTAYDPMWDSIGYKFDKTVSKKLGKSKAEKDFEDAIKKIYEN